MMYFIYVRPSSQAINKSLSALGDVVAGLAQRGSSKSGHVPFRNSKLTCVVHVGRSTRSGLAQLCLFDVRRLVGWRNAAVSCPCARCAIE
jgi:hypothetical protein